MPARRQGWQVGNDSPVKQVKISGYVGTRITDCIEHRVKAQDVDHLVELFRHQNEKSRWQRVLGEMDTGCDRLLSLCNRDPELYQIIKDAAESLYGNAVAERLYRGIMRRNTSYSNGCLGAQVYTLGLIAWYDLSGDKKALEAACRVVDHLMTQVGARKVDIVSTGNYIGMPSSSVLEPVMYLYNRTKENVISILPNILSDNGRHPVVRQLISKAIADVPANRFPHPKTWFFEGKRTKSI